MQYEMKNKDINIPVIPGVLPTALLNKSNRSWDEAELETVCFDLNLSLNDVHE